MIRKFAPLLLVALAACATDTSAPQLNVVPAACENPAPLLGQPDSRIPNQYIVVFQNGIDAHVVVPELGHTHGFTPLHVYHSALSGFAAQLTPDVVAALRCDPRIRYIDYDKVYSIG